MSSNMPRIFLLNRFYLIKENYDEIRWPFIFKKSNEEEAAAATCKNQLGRIFKFATVAKPLGNSISGQFFQTHLRKSAQKLKRWAKN
jgi:hypothetical protein